MSYNGIASSDYKEISNLFATFIKTTYSTKFFNEFEKYPYSLQSFDFPIPVISEWSVLCSLKALKLYSSPGPDNIPSCRLKNCADNLCYPLFILFNKSVNISYFPEIWKESYIIPVHKSGKKMKFLITEVLLNLVVILNLDSKYGHQRTNSTFESNTSLVGSGKFFLNVLYIFIYYLKYL